MVVAHTDPSAAIALVDASATKYELGEADIATLIEKFFGELEPVLKHPGTNPEEYLSQVASALSLRSIASRSPKRTEFFNALQTALKQWSPSAAD